MFVRFRPTAYRLQATLVETRRVDGRVRHEHIASFGSVEMPPSVEDRIAFWQRLHERLAKLSNRVDARAHAKSSVPSTPASRWSRSTSSAPCSCATRKPTSSSGQAFMVCTPAPSKITRRC